MENVTNIINEKKFTTNKVVLENRKKLVVNGAEKALSSNETCIILVVSGCKMFINGNNLHIEKLDVESGVVEIEGSIDGFKFGNNAGKGNVFKRIFK